MVKKFSVAIIFIFCLMFNVSAGAQAVQIYDGRIEGIIDNLKQYCNIWGTEYYTYQGAKRLELHFGDSDENLVRFRLNNDNSVSRFLVTMLTDDFYSDTSDTFRASFIIGFVLARMGLEQSAFSNLWTNFINDAKDFAKYNSYATHFHKKYSVWSSKTSRYFVMDVEVDPKKTDFYFYAHD